MKRIVVFTAMLLFLSCSDTITENITPEEIPNDTVPNDTVPNDTVPNDTVPNDTVPNDTVPNDTVPNDTVPNDTTAENPLGLSAEELELISLVNKARSEGTYCADEYFEPVSPIQWDTLLAKAALLHSTDMSENSYFSHTSQDGTEPGERISATGYRYTTWGENIANGYQSASAVITGWLGSEGHCRNIMNSQFSEMGVGHSGSYWTQIFASPQQ